MIVKLKMKITTESGKLIYKDSFDVSVESMNESKAKRFIEAMSENITDEIQYIENEDDDQKIIDRFSRDDS